MQLNSLRHTSKNLTKTQKTSNVTTSNTKSAPWSYSGDKMKFIDIFKVSLWDGGFFSRCKHYFYDMPDALAWGEWSKWETKTKKKHPISWFFIDTIPDFFGNCWRPIKDTYYHRKCKHIKKYHHIKIDVDRFFVGNDWNADKPLRNYHWLDSDTKILFGNFQILVDFVEREKNIVDWQVTPEHQKVYEEFTELYKWWTEDRLKRPDAYPDSADFGLTHEDIFGPTVDRKKSAYKKWTNAVKEAEKVEETYNNEDTEMLIRLITIRNYLWT